MRIMGSSASVGLIHRVGRANRQLGRSLERVASGKRINSGRDDAAGLAIASRMKAQSRSLYRTQKNIEDGIGLQKTADSGLQTVAQHLYRLRELAIQAASDTNTQFDKAMIQNEVNAVLLELDRISNDTEIFDRKPLHDLMNTEVENPPTEVDVAFMIDDSGTMGGEMANLKASMQSFKDRLEAVSDTVRFGLMKMGIGEDFDDAANMRADIGDSNFEPELQNLGPPPRATEVVAASRTRTPRSRSRLA